MPALEKVGERKVCEYAEFCGVLILKLNVLGRRGWPDRMFIYHSGLIFIEFKREGETTKKLQEHIHRTIRLHGFDVAVVDDVDQGKRVIDELVNRKP